MSVTAGQMALLTAWQRLFADSATVVFLFAGLGKVPASLAEARVEAAGLAKIS